MTKKEQAVHPRKRRKHRTCNPQEWKQTVRKRLRQSGQSYINTSGVEVGERNVRPGCGITCRLNCSARITEDERKQIHCRFWRLSDEKKNYFYWKYTARTVPKKRRPQTLAEGTQHETVIKPRREYTFHYTFEIGSRMEPVCSKFFFATLDITARRIYYFYEHHYDTETCTPRDDPRRGLNPKPALPNMEQRLDALRTHIITSRNNAVKEVNVAKMYKSYAETSENPLKKHWYYKMCKEYWTLGTRA